MNDPTCSVQHWIKIKEEILETDLNTDSKEDVTSQIKLEVPDLEIHTAYENVTIKQEKLHDELDIKTEIHININQSKKEIDKNNSIECSPDSAESTCIGNVYELAKPSASESPLNCQSTFIEESDFHKHNKIHTEEKRFKCGACRFASKWKCRVEAHMKTHTREKPYKCDVCGFACVSKHNLRLHMKTHTGERPYKCSVCSYASVRKQHLEEHMKTHTEDKPFKCSVCKFACVRKSDLKRHMKTITHFMNN